MQGGWGREVVTETVRGVSMQVYRTRGRSLTEVRRSARSGPGPALVQGDRRLDRRQLDVEVRATARILQSLGVARGDRVALVLENGIPWISAFWALQEIGAVAVLPNLWWRDEEMHDVLATVQPSLVVTTADRGPAFAARGVAIYVPDPAAPPAAADGDEREDPAVVDEDDDAVILFTSGTSGTPKGVRLSHRAIVASVQISLDVARRFPTDEVDEATLPVSLLTLPLFHVGGLSILLMGMVTGGTLAMLEGRFHATKVLKVVDEERVTTWSAVPTMVQRVVQAPELASHDLSSLRTVGMGGSSVPAALRAKVSDVFPRVTARNRVSYGLSESAGTVVTGSGAAALERPGTAGRPLPTVELAIAGTEAHGEVLVRGPMLMSGYVGDVHGTGPIDADGWLHTGDIGRIDEDGWLYIVDRAKDIIIRGGENIASARIEAALCEHPLVEGAAVVGLPDADLGEEVGAVVCLARGGEVSSEELTEHARARLSYHEVPSRWWLRTEPLPTNATGKVLKADLRAGWLEREYPTVEQRPS